MWILSCSGDLFGGKRLWLRPGSTHLLGRTSNKAESGERVQYIDHKSVSRKHLLINVSNVHPGECLKLHQRTSITVTDGSKMGTTLNGDKIMKEAKTLDQKEYTIKLGSYEPTFKLLWHNVTLTCTNLSKKNKGTDVLATQMQQLAGTDIKLSTDYVSTETSHVVAKKRNVPPALQALAQARWLVTYAFIDALAAAAHRELAHPSEEQSMSLLEQDFDANWPQEEDCLVPSGAEPVKRSDDYLKPRPERAEVFQNYVFIFLSHSQYDTLMPIVTSGGGKAVVWEIIQGKSKVEDLVGYVKEVAGKKGNSRFRLSQHSGRGGVVLVRHGESDAWFVEFQDAAEITLDQSSILQNEFLDAILIVSADALKRPVAETQRAKDGDEYAHASRSPSHNDTDTRQPTTTVQEMSDRAADPDQPQDPPQPSQAAQEQASAAPVPAARRQIRRTIQQPRFQGFGDIDPSQFQRPASESPPPSMREPSQAPSVQSVEVEGNEPAQVATTQRSTRKRPAPAEEAAMAESAMYDSITSGYAAVKRMRTEAAQNGRGDSFSKAMDHEVKKPAPKVKAPKKEKQVDVKAELAKRREIEAEALRKDEEALREMVDLDPTEYQNLAKIETMELPVREPRMRNADENGHSDRWDAAWNGRKNFKKFRAQGQRRDVPRLQRVIVTLEEVPRRSQGIGQEYWLNKSTSTASTRDKSKSQSQSQATRAMAPESVDTGDAALRFRRRLERSYEEDEEDVQAMPLMPEEIAGQPRDDGLETQLNGTPSQTMATESQRRAAGKRAAPQPPAGGPPAKKARQTRAPVISLDDDDDDGLKFRRRRR